MIRSDDFREDVVRNDRSYWNKYMSIVYKTVIAVKLITDLKKWRYHWYLRRIE